MRTLTSFRSILFPRVLALLAILALFSLVGCGEEELDNQEVETPVETFSVGGTAVGVSGSFIIRNNGTDDINISEDGPFEFSIAIEDQAEYSVTTHAVPAGVDCEVLNDSGVVDGAPITDVEVVCTEVELDPAIFTVEIDEAASTLEAEEGNPIQVVANVTNTGEASATQTITMEIGGFNEDSISGIQLAGGETRAVTLSWWTVPGNAGDYTAIVASDNDSDTVDITVTPQIILDPPNFEIEILEDSSTLRAKAGESIFIEFTVENTGEIEATQDITLQIGGVVVDTIEDVYLDEEDSETFTLEWVTTLTDVGNHTAVVASEDAVASISVIVDDLDPAFYDLTINEAASELHVDEEQTISVAVDITNTGDVTGSQTLTLEIDGVVEDTLEDVEVAGGATETFTLEWQTAAGESGFYTAEVFSEETSDSRIISVNDPDNDFLPYFLLSIDESASSLLVDHGETVILSVDIENLGDLTGTQTITLEIDGVVEDDFELELEANESTTITLEWETEVGDSNIYTAVVSSEDYSDSATVLVIDPDALIVVQGVVSDSVTEDDLEGVEVVFYEAGTDTVVSSTFAGADGIYELPEAPQAEYELGIRGPGLAPGYSIEEGGGAERVPVSLFGVIDSVDQDLTVDWLRQKDIYINGGVFDLEYGDPDGDLVINLPGCVQQADGSWEPTEPDTPDDIELVFSPDGQCFQINNVAIDIGTGALSADPSDALFPKVTLILDDTNDDQIDEMVDMVEVDFEWIFDSITGFVDFNDGSLSLDLDHRILIGGNVQGELNFGGFPIGTLDEDFGSRDGNMDCQLTGAWGGDVSSPQPDTDGDQIGNYLHDPIQMRLTTGTSGVVTGQPADQSGAMWLTVDNEMTIDRLSEGSDPGGGACGIATVLIESIDFAEILNDLANLPAGAGSIMAEFEFLRP